MAQQAAIESEQVTTEVVEISEFPILARRFAVSSVPKILVNDERELIGSVSESRLVAALSEQGRP